MEAVKGPSGQICKRTPTLQPHRDDAETTLMAGYVAFRAERCDMQAFTLTVCLSHAHLHTHTYTHTPQGLPLITADLCTFRLWNDSRADQRTAYHTFLHVSSFHRLWHTPPLSICPSITPSRLASVWGVTFLWPHLIKWRKRPFKMFHSVCYSRKQSNSFVLERWIASAVNRAQTSKNELVVRL